MEKVQQFRLNEDVLILVVVEIGLGECCIHVSLFYRWCVLILVVVEIGLGEDDENQWVLQER